MDADKIKLLAEYGSFLKNNFLPELAEEMGAALTLENMGTGDPMATEHAKVFLQFAQQKWRNVDS